MSQFLKGGQRGEGAAGGAVIQTAQVFLPLACDTVQMSHQIDIQGKDVSFR